MHIDRRGLLGAAAGLLAASPTFAANLRPTPRNELGPFYKRGVPHQANLIRPGDTDPLEISGAVYRTNGWAIAGAHIELWQADAAGHYDVVGDHLRADLLSDPQGAYAVQTIMPGHYPDRVCQHVHFLVRAPGFKPLVTQLYFETDPVFEGNADRNFGRDSLIQSRELVRPVAQVGRGAARISRTTFELVLEAL